MTKKSELPEGLREAFKTLNSMNEDSSILDDNALSVVKDYIDTGSFALNAIVSGSLHGGFPKGRITGLVGPEQCGKTHILCKAIANEQKKDSQVWGVIWDSESAYDINTIKNVGGDPNRIKVCPVETIEDCRNQISNFLDVIIKNPDLSGKIVIGIDSLGNLASAKEIEDSRKGKDASDMGMRSKACLDPETKVLLKDGTYKLIKDIKIGDELVTHLKRIRRVNDIWITKHTELICLKINGKTIKMSKNHKLLISRDEKLQYIRADLLVKTDKLVKLTR